MLLVLKAFTDIIFIRRGPEDLPYSTFLLGFALALWMLTFALAFVLIDWFGAREFFVSAVSSLLAILCYQGLVVLYGKTARSVQMLTALIGCGSLISIVFVIVVWLSGFLAETGASVVATLALLLSFWSVPVKGHIIARTLDMHWYVGIAMAAAIFVLQDLFTTSVSGAQ